MTVPRWILITKDMATVRRDKEKETGKESTGAETLMPTHISYPTRTKYQS